MKTLLIVEDEKLTRQTIKAIVQNSGVPVEVIIECNNGEVALEMVKEQKIDVMLTDICMPKMDGIGLVKGMQECEHIPYTVVISGHDDFSAAVEMMRCGVRDYLLKPVDKERLSEVLRKLNAEIESSREIRETHEKISYQQMKHLMLTDYATGEEIASVEKQYAGYFFKGNYRVCCRYMTGEEKVAENRSQNNYILLKNIALHDIYIVPEENVDFLLKNELQAGFVGISELHCGIRELKQAYEEALAMRKQAFMKMRKFVTAGETEDVTSSESAKETERFLSYEANLQRVQLIGTERTEELRKSMKQLFVALQSGNVNAEQMEACMKAFFVEMEKTYRNLLGAQQELLTACKQIWGEMCIADYEEKLMRLVLFLHETINSRFEVNKNTRKMRMAIEYVEEHYAQDLNMAVVSNYISMNYSLFSYSFKQYTGTTFVNFLRDIRMREAQRLLAESNMKIVEISQMVGYDNEKHFMKTFKSCCGVSPSEYRKNMSSYDL